MSELDLIIRTMFGGFYFIFWIMIIGSVSVPIIKGLSWVRNPYRAVRAAPDEMLQNN